MRVRLGASANTAADVLHDLAADPSVTVRAALALNDAAPTAVTQQLAADPDERVRVVLAARLAKLVPTLSPTDQAQLYDETWEILRRLVKDEAARVRGVIAKAIQELEDAPHDVVLRLARDSDVTVYDPVIRFSPLLTTEDLVSLVVNAEAAGTRQAVASRHKLHVAVADAIAATTDSVAIRALLANPSAQIREVTLDALVARSVHHPEWHEPLVTRPTLPPHSARMLSKMVAEHLLASLAKRGDLPEPLTNELRQRVAAQLSPAESAGESISLEEAMGRAQTLAAKGALDEEAILDVARRGEAVCAEAMLAVAAHTPVSVVERAASLRSAKGIVSLAWKAGLSMRAALALQGLLARLPPDAILMPGAGGNFPLSIDEMRWQLDFLGRVGP